MPIKAFGPELAVEALDVHVLHWLAGLDELRGDVVTRGLGAEHATPELPAIVERETRGLAPRGDHRLKGGDDGRAREAVGHRDREALPRAAVDERQAANALARGALVGGEVEAPRVNGPERDPARHRQALEPIEPLHALLIHEPAVAV